METSLDYDNYFLGDLGENLVRDVKASFGYTNINYQHQSRDRGLDVTATSANGKTSASEVHNWYGGYCHDLRFNSVTAKLILSNADEKEYFAFGVTPTIAQINEANGYNITVIHLNHQINRSNLPTSFIELRKIYAKEVLGLNISGYVYNKFYKVSCIGNSHLANDNSLLLPIFYNNLLTSYIIPKLLVSRSSNEKSPISIPFLAISSSSIAQTNKKTNDIRLENNATAQAIDYDLFNSLSPIRKLEYGALITSNIIDGYEVRIPKLPSGIEKAIAIAEYQAIKLMFSALYVKIRNLNNYSKNAYVR